MKASIVFNRWCTKNSQRLIEAGAGLVTLTGRVLRHLEAIEMNPNGLSVRHADEITADLVKLKAEITKRGLPMPKLDMPKIKAVVALSDKAKRPRR